MCLEAMPKLLFSSSVRWWKFFGLGKPHAYYCSNLHYFKNPTKIIIKCTCSLHPQMRFVTDMILYASFSKIILIAFLFTMMQ